MAYLAPLPRTRQRLGLIAPMIDSDGSSLRTFWNAPRPIARPPIIRVTEPPILHTITPAPQIPVENPITYVPPAAAAPASAGTPVPSGFPTNQFFVSSDGSVWQYSGIQGKWLNTGTPFNINAPGPAPAPTTTTSVTDGGTPAIPAGPGAVAPATAPDSSGYQAVLDWLAKETLINGVPNWGVALAAAGALLWLKNSSGGRR